MKLPNGSGFDSQFDDSRHWKPLGGRDSVTDVLTWVLLPDQSQQGSTVIGPPHGQANYGSLSCNTVQGHAYKC